jgi:hypothetical protein
MAWPPPIELSWPSLAARFAVACWTPILIAIFASDPFPIAILASVACRYVLLLLLMAGCKLLMHGYLLPLPLDGRLLIACYCCSMLLLLDGRPAATVLHYWIISFCNVSHYLIIGLYYWRSRGCHPKNMEYWHSHMPTENLVSQLNLEEVIKQTKRFILSIKQLVSFQDCPTHSRFARNWPKEWWEYNCFFENL